MSPNKREPDGRANFPGQIYANYIWEKHAIPEHLWHYTDGGGFLGIAKTKSLWCTEFRYLNDSAEVFLFAHQFQEELGARLSGVFSRDDVARILAGCELFQTWNVFVCAFCDDGDKNEHWQHYARRAGYALGFDPHALRNLARQQSFDIGPVMYGADPAAEIAAAVIDDNMHKLTSFKSPLSQDNVRSITNFFCRLILQFAPFFKPSSFEREREWRIVRVAGIGDAELRFRSSEAFGIVQYVEFGFMVDRRGRKRLTGAAAANLIPRIMVGPGNETHEWLRQVSPEEVLSQQGFATTVSLTGSSYRFVR